MQQFKLALRILLKDRVTSIINILGLTLALTVSTVISLYVYHHSGFDKNVSHPERSYRIVSQLGDGATWASTFTAFAEALKENPHLEDFSVFYKQDEEFDLSAGDKTIKISDPIYGDSDFLSYFNIPLKLGNPEDINRPDAVFISEETAHALFGNQNPIGQSVTHDYKYSTGGQSRSSVVMGVLDQVNSRSHIRYDFINSKKGFFESTINQLLRRKVYAAYIYITLFQGTSADTFEAGLSDLLKPYLKDAPGPPLEAFNCSLQPLQDIHFTPGLLKDISPAVKRSVLTVLSFVGAILFVIVLFNFIIMNIACAERKKSRIWITQLLGATRRSVWGFSLVEIALQLIPVLILTTGLIVIFNPLISEHYFNGWSVNIYSFAFWTVLALMSVTIIAASTINAHFQLIRNKRPNTKSSKRAVPLLVVQFLTVIAVIGFTLLLNKQIHFIQDKDLGYSPDNVMIFRVPGRTDKIPLFKEQARKVAGVKAVGASLHYPGYRLQDLNLKTSKAEFSVKFAMVDPDALEVMGIQKVESFSHVSGMNFFVNKTFYNNLKAYYSSDEIVAGDFNPEEHDDQSKMDFFVNGVVKDFHYASLYESIDNFVFFIQDCTERNYRFFMVRYAEGQGTSVAQEMKSIARSLYNSDLEPQYLFEELRNEYRAEEQILSVIQLFSILTILIGAMGLFAFSVYSIESRIHEIGIRKVNGATVAEILVLINSGFIKWIMIAFVIAVPILVYAVNKWLESFAYKTELSWWIFALAGLLALGIALLTVSIQSWKAATRNPVEALRYE